MLWLLSSDKPVATETFLAAITDLDDSAGANRYLLAERLGLPDKTVLSKARRLMWKGAIDGCGCGCRGDFKVS